MISLKKFYPPEMPEEIRTVIRMYYFFGIIDYCLAWGLFIVAPPKPHFELVNRGVVIFMAALAGYWVTKGEDLRKIYILKRKINEKAN